MNELYSPNTLLQRCCYLLQSQSLQECRTSTVALEDAHERGFQLARERKRSAHMQVKADLLHCGMLVCALLRSNQTVLVFNARWQILFGESNNGLICNCHLRSDSRYGSHGFPRRVYDVRGRFDGQSPQHIADVAARWVSGAHYITAVRRVAIALTRSGAKYRAVLSEYRIFTIGISARSACSND
jgi:hypothetical protein